MKKNFFKKLSFVLALAMIISVVAPAAGAFAAAKPTLNSKLKYLHLADEVAGEFDFNIRDKQAGWKYAWTSANEAVATVNARNGITTATGIGRTTITCVITDKNNKNVATLKATVVVRDNIKELFIRAKGNPDFEKLAVGQLYDFDRDFVTNSGATDVGGAKGKTSSITRWTVEGEGASIVATNGFFTAEKAGEYTVIARAFQSAARYDSWLKDGDDAKWTSAVEEQKVTVVAQLVELKQLDLSKFKVVFDSSMADTDIEKDAVVYRIIGNTKVSTGTERIKSAKLDEETGTVLTVEMFVPFAQGADYRFEFADFAEGFKAATASEANIDSLVFSNFDVNVEGTGVNMAEKVTALNADGVEILAGTAIASKLNFTYGGELSKGFVNGSMIYLYEAGYVAPVTVKYENWVYNEDTKNYEKVEFTASAIATGTKTNTNVDTASIQYALGNSGRPADDNAAWTRNVAIAAGDSNYQLYMRWKTFDNADVWKDTDSSYNFTSNNTDVLLITGRFVYPIKQGTATVLVRENGKDDIVDTFTVVIQPARTQNTQVASDNYVSIGNHATLGEEVEIVIDVKDSLGATYTPTISVNTTDLKPTGGSLNFTNITTEDGKAKFKINAQGITQTGAYQVKATIGGFGTTRDVFVTVIVVDAIGNPNPTSWRLDLSKSSVDLKEIVADDAITVRVFGFNSAGVRVTELSASQYDIAVRLGNDAVTTIGTGATETAITDGSIAIARAVTGNALALIGTGTYVVTATVEGSGSPTNRTAGAYIDAKTFTVTNSSTKSWGLDTAAVDASTVFGAVKEAFSFTVDGDKLTDAQENDIVAIKYSTGGALVTNDGKSANLASGNSVFVSEVTYRKTNTNGSFIDYVIAVNTTIKKK